MQRECKATFLGAQSGSKPQRQGGHAAGGGMFQNMDSNQQGKGASPGNSGPLHGLRGSCTPSPQQCLVTGRGRNWISPCTWHWSEDTGSGVSQLGAVAGRTQAPEQTALSPGAGPAPECLREHKRVPWPLRGHCFRRGKESKGTVLNSRRGWRRAPVTGGSAARPRSAPETRTLGRVDEAADGQRVRGLAQGHAATSSRARTTAYGSCLPRGCCCDWTWPRCRGTTR